MPFEQTAAPAAPADPPDGIDPVTKAINHYDGHLRSLQDRGVLTPLAVWVACKEIQERTLDELYPEEEGGLDADQVAAFGGLLEGFGVLFGIVNKTPKVPKIVRSAVDDFRTQVETFLKAYMPLLGLEPDRLAEFQAQLTGPTPTNGKDE